MCGAVVVTGIVVFYVVLCGRVQLVIWGDKVWFEQRSPTFVLVCLGTIRVLHSLNSTLVPLEQETEVVCTNLKSTSSSP